MAWELRRWLLLLAYGEGFGQAITNIFQSFGARAVGVFPGRTSQQAGGNKAGVQIRFTSEDIELLQNVARWIRHISRQSDRQCTAQYGARNFDLPVQGVDPPAAAIWNNSTSPAVAFSMMKTTWVMFGWRYWGTTPRTSCSLNGRGRPDGALQWSQFPGHWCGSRRAMQEGDSDINRQIYIPFTTMDVLQDNHYLGGIWLDYEGMDHEK